ncbi:RIP metalloprotease RseP [Enterobacteriaceae endosymbiont of Donacia bicoloricornis]|uniref:RIP metalloprotease RseP n=1 Tax=Enterobacteriaceae endosymbiont of Donacia bicoloricornis TaxID=2675772 RepID=UPI0014572A57|nr:RIP metalloprotease RseP [Enterobacteriaceae endosymbiont of Donacia bicoloricornis]
MFSILYDIIIFIITISSLIIIHEYGHFYIARLFNIYIECFSIGFGKKIFQYRDKYGTNYVLRLIPLGGYIKMPSIINDNDKKYTKKFKLLFFKKINFFKQLLIILGGPIANIILAILIYWIIFFIGLPIKKNIINEINYVSIANIVGLKPNSEIRKINNKNINNWNVLNSKLNQFTNLNNEINIEINKNNFNFIQNKKLNIDKNFIRFSKEKNLILMLGIIPKGLKINPVITYIIPGSPADKSKLHIGDRILSIEGKKFIYWYNFQKLIYNNPNRFIHIKIKRKQKNMNFVILTSVRKSKKIGFLGFLPQVIRVKDTSTSIYKLNLIESLKKSISETLKSIKLILNSLFFLLKNKKNFYKLNGPISIGHIASILIRNNFIYYFMFFSLININLGIINLLPIPILDGGQLLFLIYEKIIGKKIPYKIKQLIYTISIIILTIIMGFTFINDFKQF